MSNDVKFHPEDSAPRLQLLPHLYLFKVVSRTSHVQRRTRKAGQGARGGRRGRQPWADHVTVRCPSCSARKETRARSSLRACESEAPPSHPSSAPQAAELC